MSGGCAFKAGCVFPGSTWRQIPRRSLSPVSHQLHSKGCKPGVVLPTYGDNRPHTSGVSFGLMCTCLNSSPCVHSPGFTTHPDSSLLPPAQHHINRLASLSEFRILFTSTACPPALQSALEVLDLRMDKLTAQPATHSVCNSLP